METDLTYCFTMQLVYSHMEDYLKFHHGPLNRLLQAVLSDLSVPKYIAGCKALGIIDKIVTGPLW